MARYGQAYKARIVARLLPPESSSVEHVSREVAISVATLERWRGGCLVQWSWRRQAALDGGGTVASGDRHSCYG